MMDATRERMEEIVCAALELKAPDKRTAFLDRACAGDSNLRSAVEEMLASQTDVEKFFHEGSPALASAREIFQAIAGAPGFRESVDSILSAEEVGKRIGPYKLLQNIGEGGCGSVYMAEQETPVRRRVALKVIKLGMDTKSVIARFEAERQALAMMDHPNIARVLDAGATETGRPYFVMELVRGIKITAYCDENRLDARQRLDLFIQVCHAIQHAHQKGIIHRDIKPSNILITMHDGVPVPKVIDFGIAKATSGQLLTDKTLFTAYQQFVGTPAYMSPEQAEMSGLDVDTRSDIYSLGVLLYELLTGKTPFDQQELLQSGFDEMRRTLREREPHRPSTKLDGLRAEELTQTAIHRRVEPRRLKLLLSGDLDWIVMKALEKDRNRRYQTANGLEMEIQRYLGNEPVIARPPSRLYRFQKLVRRNKTVFAAIGAVSIALVAGLGTSSWLFVREREARQEQARLREEAEHARNNETRLRREAEARAKIEQAAVLLNRGKSDEADRLVDKIQIPVTEPSLEAAGVFRGLGDWNVTQGRWKQAADRFLKLIQANQVDKSDMTDEATRDLLRAGPTLVAIGDMDNYQHLIQATIARFASTTNPVAAEHVIKVSLILPANPATIKSLEPLARVVEQSIAGVNTNSSRDIYMVAWRALALSLFEYRRGNFTNAVAWGQRCLGYSDHTPTRVAMSHLILAMAFCQIHQPDAARSELAQGRELVELKLPNGLEKIPEVGNDGSGFWHDWVMAHLLLREATACIESASASVK